MHSKADGTSNPDGAVLCWIAPPVVHVLEAAAATLAQPTIDAAGLGAVRRGLREARGALTLGGLTAAAQVLEMLDRVLAQPDAPGSDDCGLCHAGCDAVREYVCGLCDGMALRPDLLSSVGRALRLRIGAPEAELGDADFSGGAAGAGPDAVVSVRAQRERLRRLQDLWERYATGDAAAVTPFDTVLHELSAEGLPHAQLAALVDAVRASLDPLGRPAALQRDGALAVATSLLFLDDALAAWPEVGETLQRQVDALTDWLRAALSAEGAALPQVDLQQEAHRRQQERALAARLSSELAELIRRVEHHLLAFFEDDAAQDTLRAAETTLQQAQAVLRLMTDEPAAAIAAHCAERVGAWRSSPGPRDLADRSEIAATVCALEYYVEQLAFGAADLHGFLRRAGVAEAVVAMAAPRQLGTVPAPLASVAVVTPAPPVSSHAAAAAQPESDAASVDAPVDREMLQIFLEEAAEVMRTVRAALEGLAAAPGDVEQLGVVRRAYHTLKGSGRMVGLVHLGEAAWAIEQVLNGVLSRPEGAGSDLLRLLERAQRHFDEWIARLAADGRVAVDAATLSQWAACLRRGEPLPVDAPAVADGADRVCQAEAPAPGASGAAEAVVVIGATRISPALFATFLAEAGRHLATLGAELEALHRHPDGAASYESFRAAHTLAGIAGTAGLQPLSALAGEVERVLQLLHHHPRRLSASDAAPLSAALIALEAMVSAVGRLEAPTAVADQVAAVGQLADRLLAESGVLHTVHGSLLPAPAVPQSDAAAAAPAADAVREHDGEEHGGGDSEYATASAERRRGRIVDDLDNALLPVFLEEAEDVVPQIGQTLRDWRAQPQERRYPELLQRLLHTLKGSARMAGAMALGELTHSVETRVADAAERDFIPERIFDSLYVSFDRMGVLLEQLERGQIESSLGRTQLLRTDAAQPSAAPALLRVRAELIDRLVDEAGEVSIARARMETDLRTLRAALRDLTESVIRLRAQVREVEIQAETQMESRLAQAKQSDEQFDPLELDRFTRLQELTRFLAESVSDVAALQQSILESADEVETALSAQRQAARAVQDGLMRVRLIPIATLTERLYRVARLTARETDKRVDFELRGARVELDRGVVERIAGPLEHLLRNAIVHGVEPPERRRTLGKAATGRVVLDVRQDGNEVVLTLSDDGAGLDLPRIQERARAAGLIRDAAALSDDEAAQLVFAPGLSTSDRLTQEAGRGVGLDVVRNEIGALGGRIQLAFEPGAGTTFTVYLPVTLSVLQAVLVSSGGQTFALPTLMVEQVQKVKAEVLAQLFAAGELDWQGNRYPLHDLQRLLGNTEHVPAARRYNALALLRSGELRAAVHVDELLGSQEIIVKNLGSQLARVAGIAGAAVLGSGENVLILNPIALTQALFGAGLRGQPLRTPVAPVAVAAEAARPLVMIVDDSLTIRRITGRLLARAGYEVVEARDGVEALEKLRSVVPGVMLLDIEMPRMDGYELTRRVRDDPRLRRLPIIVISSRTADKHRQHAAELGVNLFLGKPYQEEALLGHIAAFVAGAADAAVSA